MKNDIVIIPGLPHVKTAYWKGPVASVYVDNWWNMKVLKGCHFHRQTVQLLSLVTLFWGDKGTLENSTGIEIGKGDWATVSAGRSAASQILFGIGVVSTKLFGQILKILAESQDPPTPRGHFIKNPCFPLRRKCSDQDLLWWNIISKGAQTRSGSPPTATAAFKAANTEDILWKKGWCSRGSSTSQRNVTKYSAVCCCWKSRG